MGFFRHTSEAGAKTTLGNTTKDIAYLLVSGIDQVEWGNKNMNACLKGGKYLTILKWIIVSQFLCFVIPITNLAMVGYMLPSTGYDATKDYTCIAGESKIHH